MELPPEYRTPTFPILSMEGLNQEDLRLAKSLEGHLIGLTGATDDLVAGIALYEVARAHRLTGLYHQWAFMGARAGAMALRNFGQALAKIRKIAGRISPWKEAVDLKALKDAEQAFRKAFPKADKIRHSVAHPELYADPNKSMGSKKPFEDSGVSLGPGAVIQDGIINGQFTATFEGELIQYPVTVESARELLSVTRRIFDAFAALDRMRG